MITDYNELVEGEMYELVEGGEYLTIGKEYKISGLIIGDYCPISIIIDDKGHKRRYTLNKQSLFYVGLRKVNKTININEQLEKALKNNPINKIMNTITKIYKNITRAEPEKTLLRHEVIDEQGDLTSTGKELVMDVVFKLPEIQAKILEIITIIDSDKKDK